MLSSLKIEDSFWGSIELASNETLLVGGGLQFS